MHMSTTRTAPGSGWHHSTAFSELKQKVDTSLKGGFDRAKLAEIFLGGNSPTDACIAMSSNDFEDAIDGVDLLLHQCGERLLGEAFLYNSIKHGLSTIALDESTEIAVTLGKSVLEGTKVRCSPTCIGAYSQVMMP